MVKKLIIDRRGPSHWFYLVTLINFQRNLIFFSYIFFTSVTQSLGEEKECKLTFLIIYLCINKIISFSPPHYLPKRFPAQASFLVTGHAIHAFNFLSKRCSFEGKGKGFWIAFSIIFKNIQQGVSDCGRKSIYKALVRKGSIPSFKFNGEIFFLKF